MPNHRNKRGRACRGGRRHLSGVLRSANARLNTENKWREQTHCAIFKLLPNVVISWQWFFKCSSSSSKARPLLCQRAWSEGPEQKRSSVTWPEETRTLMSNCRWYFRHFSFS